MIFLDLLVEFMNFSFFSHENFFPDIFSENNTKTCIQIQREVAKHDMREKNFEQTENEKWKMWIPEKD